MRILILVLVLAAAACAPARNDYWGDLAKGVGDVLNQ